VGVALIEVYALWSAITSSDVMRNSGVVGRVGQLHHHRPAGRRPGGHQPERDVLLCVGVSLACGVRRRSGQACFAGDGPRNRGLPCRARQALNQQRRTRPSRRQRDLRQASPLALAPSSWVPTFGG